MRTGPIGGLSDLIDRYDGFIVDQWGVLHDGAAPLPGALEALDQLHGYGKRIVLLSNSGRRRTTSLERLTALGFAVDRFDGVVTSGEVNWQALRAGRLGDQPLPGKRCFLICRENDHSVIDGTGVEATTNADQADFVALCGIHGEDRTVAAYLEDLAGAIRRRLPVICSNPDLVAVTPSGNAPAPGSVAIAYAERAGVEPIFVGKPHAPVYAACFECLGDIPKERILAVGDSLDHDIRGGHDAGVDTLFLAQGIEAEAFDAAAPIGAQLDRLGLLLEPDDRVAPTWIAQRFQWT